MWNSSFVLAAHIFHSALVFHTLFIPLRTPKSFFPLYLNSKFYLAKLRKKMKNGFRIENRVEFSQILLNMFASKSFHFESVFHRTEADISFPMRSIECRMLIPRRIICSSLFCFSFIFKSNNTDLNCSLTDSAKVECIFCTLQLISAYVEKEVSIGSE